MQNQVVSYKPASYEFKTETNYAPIELKTEVVAPTYEFKEFKMEEYAIPSSTYEFKEFK